MELDKPASAVPQFETAEFQPKSGADTCVVCHQPISGSYYRVNNRMTCAACAERLRHSIPPDSHSAFMRALALGAGGAIVGLALYSLVTIVTGLMIGYVSLAVGWIVGKAMMKGSGGLGGRRYQIAAVIFTYGAVSLSAIPIWISSVSKQKKEAQPQAQVQKQQPDSAEAADSGTAQESPEATPEPKKTNFMAAFGYLALLGLASPFLELGDPLHGIIGLVILLVGIRIAWQITRGRSALVIDGPF